ncbi:MAG: type II toxin-antitoxin system VapC family toxin [Rhodocyclaceae bacterium]|nr:type II toxin-antitoxin system VapC family toxin [Rhodocyclaceae bacterium]
MIVLDTNVISELWRIAPSPVVLAWMDAQAIETLYLSAITVAELRYGLAVMPAGKRRTIYRERLEKEVFPAFAGRVLPFGLEATQAYADLMAQAKTKGKAIGKADGYIAAIAASRNFAVATRDTRPFEAAGLTVINPWDAAR